MSNGMRTTQQVLLGAAAVVAVVGIGAVAYGAANDSVSVIAEPVPVVAPAADAVPVAAIKGGLSESEADGIVFMREEEKLARDVYLTLADVWGTRIFSNIATAEQTHMDSVLGLIEAYGLEDPVGDNGVGVFVDPNLQQMYEDLAASGSESVEAALEVGALIEEVDIEDLALYLEETVSADVVTVYERLLRGSENHLRAFVSQLESAGSDYQPSVLDADAYESILSSEDQRGGHGAGRGSHGAGRNGKST